MYKIILKVLLNSKQNVLATNTSAKQYFLI